MARNGRSGFRESIIRTSLELGIELGEDGLTMRGIASRLGVSATALYQHFDGKGAILLEIRNHGYDRLWSEIEPRLGIQDPLERLGAVCSAYVRFCRDNPWLYSVMIRFDGQDDEGEANETGAAAEPGYAGETIAGPSPAGPSYPDANYSGSRVGPGMHPDYSVTTVGGGLAGHGAASSYGESVAYGETSPAGSRASDRSSRPLQACNECVRAASEAGLVEPVGDSRLVAMQLWAACHGLCSLILSHIGRSNRPSEPTASAADGLPGDLDAFIDDYVASVVSGFLRPRSRV